MIFLITLVFDDDRLLPHPHAQYPLVHVPAGTHRHDFRPRRNLTDHGRECPHILAERWVRIDVHRDDYRAAQKLRGQRRLAWAHGELAADGQDRHVRAV